MGILDSINQSLNQSLYPGRREIRVNGWQLAEKYPMPRDCEAIMLDADPKSDHIYMKVTDINGGERFARYKLIEDPIPKFEPGNYVTTNDFNTFKEDVLNAINSLRESGTTENRTTRPNGGNKQSGRTNNEFGRSESNVQSNGVVN